jgi:LysR family transcriptional regulator of gallate degradation
MKTSLRHLRVFLAVLRLTSVSRAAQACNLSQPAVTQAIARLEAEVGTQLFLRSPQGLFATEAGRVLAARVQRALDRLDAALRPVSARLPMTATLQQLRALIAVRDLENFSLAAARLGISQPSVHRAVARLEAEAGRALFERSMHGMIPTRACQSLAEAARLGFSELDQAASELGELAGRDTGSIAIGAMPLSRSVVLPRAISAFQRLRPGVSIRVDDGPYDDLLSGLRRGEMDFLLGALRPDLQVGDVIQQRLFDDDLVLVVGPAHPLACGPAPGPAELAAYPWVISRQGTPTRRMIEPLFQTLRAHGTLGIVESGSLVLARQLLGFGDHIACLSRMQAAPEIANGLMVPLDIALHGALRPIGITRRRDWLPTLAQQQFLDLLVRQSSDRETHHTELGNAPSSA